ncbi:MAG: TetR/AcrR family transcriptional regulator [Devosiaceae bacterium]|nr:TetR/AcrR family transcriptional regulator [Devosiaceae bacterium]
MAKKENLPKTPPTREKILATAFKLFVAHGYEGASLNAIVTASGVSKGAFYHYFPSKLEVYNQTIEAFFLTPLEQINTSKLAKLSPKKSRSFMRQHYVSLPEKVSAATDQDIGRIFALTFDSIARIPDFHKKISRIYTKILKALTTSFKTAKTPRKAAKRKARRFLAQLEGEVYLRAIQNIQ